MPKLKINETEIDVAPGTSILQAAELLGYEIPRFCYHDKLSVPANCRMCLVEVKGAPKPVASCAVACGDNMEVMTGTPLVEKARRGVMEMLLINHPLDCPICDQGGECDLQDQATGYGYDRSRYAETKRAVKDKDFGPLIKPVMTRCIQCTRCVRFADEIAGVSEIGLLNRGEDAEISTMVQKAVSSELSGNLIDVCPVGALTNGPYAYRARPWELRKVETIDVHDAVGSNIRVDVRGNEVMRVLPRLNEDINEEWISDKTRFAYDGLKRQRLDRPFIRENGRLRPASWDEALMLVAEKIRSTPPEKIAGAVGGLCAAEDMYALKDFFRTFGAANICGMMDDLAVDTSIRGNYLFNSGIAGIEDADAILLIGTNPRVEAPLINARIRKTYLAKRVKIGVVGEAADLSYPVEYLGQGTDGLNAILSGQSSFTNILKEAQRPLVIIGTGAVSGRDGRAIHALALHLAHQFNLMRDGWNGFNLLHRHAAQVAALDLSLTASSAVLSGADMVYLLNTDDAAIGQISPSAFVVYQGHHGDVGASRADVVFPGAAYTEKDGIYINTEGRVQAAKKAAFPPGDAKEDWKILRALSGHVGQALFYDNLFQLRERLFAEIPHFSQVDLRPSDQFRGFDGGFPSSDAKFRNPIENFYMTNAICRASTTMVRCTETFMQDASYAEAAE